jgi:hypothetical protein
MAVLDVPPIDDLGSRPTEWHEAEITTPAGHIAAATCCFLLLLAEFDRREGYHRCECISCAHWLSWKIGMSLRTARDHVRVGRALEDLPITTKAFAAGQLSYSKVRAITRVASAKSEAALVVVAMHGTAAHLDRIVAGYCTVKRNVDPDRAKAQLRRRGVWMTTEDDGTCTLTVRGPTDAIATMLRAAETAAKELPELVDEPDFKGAAKRFDGLEQVARTYAEPDRIMAARPEMIVHADLAVMTEGEPGRAEIEEGPKLTATTLERLACDCGVRLVTEREGETIDVGRAADWRRRRWSAPSWTGAVRSAGSPVARRRAACRCTTAGTGRAAVRRTCTTASSCASTTTRCCTKEGGTPRVRPPVPSRSSTRRRMPEVRLPPRRPIRMRSGGRTCSAPSRSPPRRSSLAGTPATASISTMRSPPSASWSRPSTTELRTEAPGPSHPRDIIDGCPSASVETATGWS